MTEQVCAVQVLAPNERRTEVLYVRSAAPVADLTVTFTCPDCRTQQRQKVDATPSTLYCATCEREPVF